MQRQFTVMMCMFLLFSVAARQCVPILADEIYGDMVSLGQESSLHYSPPQIISGDLQRRHLNNQKQLLITSVQQINMLALFTDI